MSIKIVVKRASSAANLVADKEVKARLFNGDCLELLRALPDNSIDLVVTSPPYCMNKEYEEGNDISVFTEAHKLILPEVIRVTKPGGSICWQVGAHVSAGEVMPLDYLVHDLMRDNKSVQLRNRIVWTFGHGLHCTNRFSGRHEVVMWYTKGDDYYFDLNAVRVPQKYPGKLANRGPNKGLPSGNPNGKNPSDIWEIPNVKSNHVEKTDHPCQYPVALVTRLVRALCPKEGIVLDIFAGVASAGVAAILENRRFLGSEINSKYTSISDERLKEALAGTAKTRPLEREIYTPGPNEKVAKNPFI